MNKLYLPFEEAVLESAKQNYDRDHRVGVLGNRDTWEKESEIYLEEARHLLESTRENYIPEFPEHSLICVK